MLLKEQELNLIKFSKDKTKLYADGNDYTDTADLIMKKY